MSRIPLIPFLFLTTATAMAGDSRDKLDPRGEELSKTELLAEYDDIVAELESSATTALDSLAAPVRGELDDGLGDPVFAVSVTVCHPVLGCFNVIEDPELCCADLNLNWGTTNLGNGFTAHCFD